MDPTYLIALADIIRALGGLITAFAHLGLALPRLIAYARGGRKP